MTPDAMIRGLLKFVAVVVAAGVVGAGVGVGLAALTGGEDDPSPAPQASSSAPGTATSSTPTTSTTPVLGTTPTRETAPAKPALVPRVQVLSAVLLEASTASGRDRRRARVSIRVRVTNRGAETLDLEDPQLLAGNDRVSADPRAANGAGTLLKPLASDASATGKLRFETTGAVTERLTTEGSARLGIAGRTVAVKLEIRKI